jgi:hypothetical protein
MTLEYEYVHHQKWPAGMFVLKEYTARLDFHCLMFSICSRIQASVAILLEARDGNFYTALPFVRLEDGGLAPG